ncbi:hypothetical protein CARUB_v10024442mg [Capsella rubella]|uniref:Uncharacterized protein n=1 Tax=Capsella rubella TaxID=81985 RepID=R0HF26_9BRAS|nr:hypothetical protein CARUB_v10024442mg [Capsella rubella]
MVMKKMNRKHPPIHLFIRFPADEPDQSHLRRRGCPRRRGGGEIGDEERKGSDNINGRSPILAQIGVNLSHIDHDSCMRK